MIHENRGSRSGRCRGVSEEIYLPSTTSIPARGSSNLARDTLPTRSVRSLSTVTIWEALATESFGRPVRRDERETFPGASAHRRLLVNGTHTTVAISTDSGRPLDNDDWPSKTGTGSGGSGQIGPPDLTLRNHHSLRSSTRRAADETKSSLGSANPAQTRFMASVTSSGACRATYSLTASVNNWLRDFLVRRASRSAPSNTSSGMEIAVFNR